MAGIVTGLVLLLSRLYLPVLALFFAVLLAALLHPLLVLLRRLRLGRAVATWLTILIALSVLCGVGWFVVQRAATSYAGLLGQLDGLATDLRGYVGQIPGADSLQLEQLQQRAIAWLQQNTSTVASGALTIGTVAGEIVTGLIVMLFLTFYFLDEGDRIWSWMVRLLPENTQPSFRGAGYRSWHVLSGWVVGTAIIALFHGVVIGLTLVLLGVPLAVPLAVLVFIGSFIPIVGALVFGGLTVLVTLATLGVAPALLVLAILLVENQIEAHLLQPFVVGRAVNLHPVAIVLALTAGGLVGGLFGAILIIPIVACLHAAAKYLTGVEDVNGEPRRGAEDRMAPKPPPDFAPLPVYASGGHGRTADHPSA
ncbi:MAG: AI-2E family transporter [Humibacillus sp.]|nr:AI-2E family transporter [Humibacillus sp.]MDN5775708.1 AI-2E family transporter [Humibacillus sp.]